MRLSQRFLFLVTLFILLGFALFLYPQEVMARRKTYRTYTTTINYGTGGYAYSSSYQNVPQRYYRTSNQPYYSYNSYGNRNYHGKRSRCHKRRRSVRTAPMKQYNNYTRYVNHSNPYRNRCSRQHRRSHNNSYRPFNTQYNSGFNRRSNYSFNRMYSNSKYFRGY